MRSNRLVFHINQIIDDMIIQAKKKKKNEGKTIEIRRQIGRVLIYGVSWIKWKESNTNNARNQSETKSFQQMINDWKASIVAYSFKIWKQWMRKRERDKKPITIRRYDFYRLAWPVFIHSFYVHNNEWQIQKTNEQTKKKAQFLFTMLLAAFM